ncbi:hypothetical protein IAU60_004473 [Kwoniella sp. DSM 27419]
MERVNGQGHGHDGLVGETRKLSIRDSTLESVGQAADIYDLYGAGGEDQPGDRASWAAGMGAGVGVGANGEGPLGRAGHDGERGDMDGMGPGGRTGLKDPRNSEVSWSGAMTFMGQGNGISVSADTIDHGYDHDRADGDRPSLEPGRNGVPSEAPAPDISITDTASPTQALSSSPVGAVDHDGHDTPMDSRRASLDPRHASLTSSVSSAGSVQHPSIARLSPRHPSTLRSRASGSAASTSTSCTDAETSMSQSSVAGSTQYPGEEPDAFNVRSTYARLESEGVHGDGWDPGVERTRGGPATINNKRATVYPSSKVGDIGQQERQFLANLDRYGFINEPLRNRSETRVALIPSIHLRKIPKLPSVSPLAGQPPAQPVSSFAPSCDAGPSARSPPTPRAGGSEEAASRRKEAERVDKWGNMMKVKTRDQGGNISTWEWRRDGQGAKLPRRVYKGIPDRWRMAAWWTLAEDRMGKGKKPSREIRSDYWRYIDLPSTFDVQIDLDVPRTISGHTMFVTRYGTGQRNLWHVLHSFSQVCETCGYVQGMGPIAATLLCYFDPERAYTLLVRLHDVYGMHAIFEPGFPGLLEAFYVQERLMEWLMPDVYRSFQRNMISSSSWGTKWYITLFVNTVPFSQQLRLWDALWLDGQDVMIVTSIAILWSFKDLLSAPNATFESILSLLSSYFVAEDEDVLMRWIRKMINQQGVKAKMDGWRVEWARLVKEGKSGKALL